MIKDTLRLVKNRSAYITSPQLCLFSRPFYNFSSGAERNLDLERDEKINESLKHKSFVRDK